MDSLSDRFTKNQIINPNSQINKSGIEICSELSKKLNKPVYLYIRNPIGGIYRSQTNMNLERCQKCGGDFTPSKRKKSVDKVCTHCILGFLDDID